LIENVFDGLVYKPESYKRIGTTNNPLAKGIDRWLDKLRSDIDDLDLDASSDFTKLNLRIFNARAYKLRVCLQYSIKTENRLIIYGLEMAYRSLNLLLIL